MPQANQAALDFMLSRRSRPAKTLTSPAPDRTALAPILTAAARSPDHGMLVPWRFIVLERGALGRLADLAETRAAELGRAPDQVEKSRNMFGNAPLSVAVVASAQASKKVPEIEQNLSAGAVCLSLLNAALASGWGANWLTGWMAFDTPFLTQGLGLAEGEFVAGFIHLGTETVTPADRPRPDLDQITTWLTT